MNDDLQYAQYEADEKHTWRLIATGLAGLLGITLIAITAVALYLLTFKGSLSTIQSDWGVFGDYIGGILNPMVGLVTVYLVLINVIIQRKELKNSVREMRNSNDSLRRQNDAIAEQSFQTTFFNWINSYTNIVSNVAWTGPGGGIPNRGHSGLSSMQDYYNSVLSMRLREYMTADLFQTLVDTSTVDDKELAQRVENTILEIWLLTKNSREDYFEGGFRSLVGVIFWVAEQPLKTVSAAKKYECLRIIASQITNAEKAFLLYESWTMRDRDVSVLKDYRILNRLGRSNNPYARFMLTRAAHLS
jgi:hypothetical protein